MSQSKLVKMDFKAGVERESTQYAEKGAWYDVDKVRFRAGKPENIGGYETKVSATFNGSGRDLITWTDNDQFKRAMFGTAQMLYEHSGDEIFDVTPVSSSASLTNAFSVAVSTNVVTVSATAHGRQTGDFVFFTSVSEVGGNIDSVVKSFCASEGLPPQTRLYLRAAAWALENECNERGPLLQEAFEMLPGSIEDVDVYSKKLWKLPFLTGTLLQYLYNQKI